MKRPPPALLALTVTLGTGGVRSRNAVRRTRDQLFSSGFLIAVVKDQQAFGGMESVMRLWKNLAEM